MSYKPPYKITPKIIDLVSKISEAVGSFYAQEELRLHRINRIKTIQGSLAIEGNSLTTDQITAILDGKPVIAPINEVQEIRNAIKAYELLDKLNPNSIEDLLKAHLTMETGLIDDAGHFRSGGVGVASGEEIIHYAPPAHLVPQLMKDLFEWLNMTDEHPLIKSCIFHYEFEFIHPFSDGNGRTGRLWQTLILSNWRPVFKNLPIENIVYKYRKEYYKAIAISGGEDGCTPFIEFILGVIDETLALESNTPRSTRDKIIEQIRNNTKITRNELAVILGITADGVKYHLQKMTADGVIVRHGSARGGYWEIMKD
ncbi:Fic family protein [Massilibacteroides sp.]|uniref:Fic family protein n=1 Tax=Massilibacteroides sp. TaxID=2034766 RepID=UPI00260DADCE|nr:Fic family protein [Massilibacteroides sp.]MDD4514472.1 Fic family protein [Massilibacteroides sp.]